MSVRVSLDLTASQASMLSVLVRALAKEVSDGLEQVTASDLALIDEHLLAIAAIGRLGEALNEGFEGPEPEVDDGR